MYRPKGFLHLLIGVAAFTAMAGIPAAARADLGVLVPAYFYPGTGGPGGVGDGWAAMAAAAHEISVTAIFNPNSGPLPGPADPNYVTAMTNLETAGGKVVAYVATGDGSTPIATVEAQINTYLSQYPGLINGFFLDEMDLLTGTLSYYQSIYAYIKSLGSSYTVIGNPGSPFQNGVSSTDYLSTANIFNIFEGPNTAPSPGAPGFDAYPYGLNWFQSYPSDRFSNIVYDVPADADNPLQSSAMLADVVKAYHTGAGYAYITDQSGGNPYGQLPSYWDQEVSALASVPEPSSFTIVLATSGLFGIVRLARRRARVGARGPR